MTTEQTETAISTQATEQVSPFISGARVAVKERYGDGYAEAFVDKVYKTGNFTLRDSKQQWRPWSPSRYDADGAWTAMEAGDSTIWHKRVLRIWNDSTDREIQSAIAKIVRRKRLGAIIERLRNLSPNDIIDEAVTAIECALPPKSRKD